MRWAAGVAVVLVLAGCGASHGRAAAPSIQAVDAVPGPQLRAELARMLEPSSPSSRSGTVAWDATGHTKPTAAQIARLQARVTARHAAEQPAKGAAPRVRARLPLAGGGAATFVAWQNRRGALCTFTQVTVANGSGGGGPSGPCVPTSGAFAPHCAAICLGSGGAGQPVRYVLSGTVAGDADALAVTTGDGRTETYPLTGPRLGDRRVFLLDLGATDWRRLTLYRHGAVVDSTTLPHPIVVIEECGAKAQGIGALNACLKAHRSG